MLASSVEKPPVVAAAQKLREDLPYAGDISPEAAWNILATDPKAQLIDVRSAPEWAFAGLPNIASLGKQTLTISWKTYPSFAVNAEFVDQVKSMIPDSSTPLLFLCKTGGRSLDAACAMAEAGYAASYNISGGFEGERDAQGRRGTINGWKATNLAWEQA